MSNVLKPLDDRNLVRPEMLAVLDKQIEDPALSLAIIKDIQANEPIFDDYIWTRVNDHIQWLKDNHQLPEGLEEIVAECLYKFGLLGFVAGKNTFSTKLPNLT